ncbi:paREP10 [Pyrobaculum ferrireducens]|jgi:hypothetical protein|uniref:PaREP10 n=2 Tax=Pyrobaculum ferrireducens TaxID=1104324 RepID=G7VFA4_9CREN|nr:paREP10 [Pyrobaculum ferrireducens]
MYGVHMALVAEVMGIHTHVLRRYGVSPNDDVDTAVAKLSNVAPHLAKFLREASCVLSS